MEGKIISGIELGSSKIATIVANVNTDSVTLERVVNVIGVSSVESKGIKKGQIVDIEEAVEAIVSSVESAERMAGCNLTKAYVAISGASISSINSHGIVAVSNPQGEIQDEDIRRVIEASRAVSLPSSREIIHAIPREFIVDGEEGIKDPIGMSGVRLEVDTHIISVSSSSVRNIKKALNEVGIEILGFVFSGLAASEAVLTKTEKELGCVLIDIGGGVTTIAAFVEGSLAYSYVIPIGAKNVTNDIAIGLRISIESAEKVKLLLSSNQQNKKVKREEENDEINLESLGIDEEKKISKKTLVEGIIRPRLNEIFTMVRLNLEKENLLRKIPAGAILTGGGADTVGAIESAKRMLALPVRYGKPSGLSGLIDEIEGPAFSTLSGLILYASKNLLEEETPLTFLVSRFKLPKGIFSRLINTVKQLLP